MAVVSDIRVPRRGCRAREIVLDGEPWRITANDVIKALKLHVGLDRSQDDLEGLLDAAEPPAARERAFRMLAYRDRTAHELVLGLANDGYARQVAATVVADLTRLGFVDDERVATVAARNLTQVRRLGRARATRELTARGIDPGLVERALATSLSTDDELAAARTLAGSLAARPGMDPGRIAGRLVRKGYRQALAIRVAREAVEAAEGAPTAWDEAPDDDGDPCDDTGSDLR